MAMAMIVTARSTRAAIACKAMNSSPSKNLAASANRRAAMLGLVGGVSLIAVPGAKALIPDDDDEEMV